MLTKSNSTKAQRRAAAREQLNNKKKSTPRMRVKRRRAGKVGRGVTTAYGMCRLSPFKSVGRSTGIPDGSANRRLLVDHRMTVTMTCGSTGTLCFMVVPSVPSPVWVLANDPGNVINGIGTTNNVGPTSNMLMPVCLPEWYNLPITHKATAGNLDDATPIYNSAKFRIVTAGWDLKYLGTTMSDSGIINVTSVDATASRAGPNTTTFSLYSANNGTNTNYSADNVLVLEYNSPPYDVKNWGTNLDQGSLVVPLKKGAHGLLRHSGPDYTYSDLSRNLQFLSNDANNLYSQLEQLWSGATPVIMGEAGNVSGYDNNWASTMIRVSGMQSGQSILLDLVMCVEYVPLPTSTAYALAKGSPKENLDEIRRVDRIAKDMPIAQVGSILDSVDSVVKLGKLVGSVML